MVEEYQMRGNRVAPMERKDIATRAIKFCKVFNLSKDSELDFAVVFENLSNFGITLKVISNKQWKDLTYNLTDGHCDPDHLAISIPNKTYVLACKGNRDALFTLFHELGHLLLGHKAVLHHSSINPKCNEDAEWQADSFAEIVLSEIDKLQDQMIFDFGI